MAYFHYLKRKTLIRKRCMWMSLILEVKNASKQFGGLMANENISFTVDEGSIVGVVGPNGAGKTTLFNSISGAHNLTSGSIVFDGIDITAKKANEICKMGLGRTFQIPQSLNDMTVYENVLVGSLCKYSDISSARKVTEETLEICGIAKFKDSLAGNMNVIQKKRIEIARALATKPKLLLLDETMAGLTTKERQDAIELIRLINSKGITILTIEHVMDVVMNVSDKVVVINSGKLLVEGTPEEITSNEEVIKAYLGESKDVRS
jgi:branched-chain amino acid transport system ATP-binding protein